MSIVFERIASVGILPIIILDDLDAALPLAEALMEGGLPLAEVVLRTEVAPRALAAMAAIPGLLVGAGTVMTSRQVDEAFDAGASFALAPHFNPRTAAYAHAKGLPYVPGVLTPTEMSAAQEAGFSVQKVFPAETAGGPAYLKAVSAPLRGIRFLPTGSITLSRLPAYLQLPAVLAVGGNWMVAPQLIADKNWKEITRLAAEAVATVRTIRGAS